MEAQKPKMIKLKPVNGAKIPDPKTRKIIDAEIGILVDENDIFWHRRIEDGSMELVVEEKKPVQEKKVSTTK